MQPIDVDASEAIEFLDRMQFFGGQRTWRELWADMPKKVQDADLAAFNRDVELLRKVVLSKVESTTIEAEPVRHGKWEEYQIPHIICCSECDYGTCVDEKTKFCPNCGAKMDLEEEHS